MIPKAFLKPLPRKRRGTKRIAAFSCSHCGHLVGLTPPLFQKRIELCNWIDTAHRDKLAQIARECWDAFASMVPFIRPLDVAVWVGDLVDGKGGRSGGTELIEPDRDVQADIAKVAILTAGGKKLRLLYGTPYHTGLDEDWEKIVVDKLREHHKDVKIGAHEWFDVNGRIFDFRHDPGGTSQVPHTRFTAMARQWLWNRLWAEHELQPKADVLVRAHTHYAINCGEPGDWQAYSMPALQAMGTKFGSRRCSGIVHWGFYVWDVEADGTIHFYPRKVKIPSQKAIAEVV